MVRRTLAALALLLAARGAADAPAAPEPELGPAFLQLWINEVPGPTSLALLSADGDVWVSPDHLARAGLVGVAGARRDVEGRTFVSLRSLAPELRFELDEEALAIRIRAGIDLLRRRTLDFRPSVRPPDLETPTAGSAFLNWSGRTSTDDVHSAFGEAGVRVGPALLDGSVSATRDAGVVRGLTALTWDDPGALRRLVAGDALVRRDPLGGAPLFAGLTFSRELSLDPYLVRAPLPGATAFATSPSTVEVWQNGTLVATEQVAPGTYDLSHLPVRSGANDLEVVVRDAFGRTEVLEVAHYQAQGLLARGLHDWTWHAGFRRERFGLESFDYGAPIVATRHRYGFTERLTGGVSAEATRDLAQGGLSGAVALPFGELEAAAGASIDGGRGGAAGLLAWRYAKRRMSFGLDGTVLSPGYAHLSLGAEDDRPRWRAGANVSFPVGPRTSVYLRWTGSESAGGRSQRADGRTSLRLARFAWLVLSAGVAQEPARGTETTVLAQVVLAAPGGATVDTAARHGSAGASGSIGAQRPLPRGPGVGYRLRGESADGGAFSALVQAQPSFGRLELAWDRTAYGEVGSAAASGGVVLVGDRLYATRPVEQSFAVVRVPGVRGVRAYLDHHEVGRTGAAGDLLVPGLLPYYASRLSIADADVPATYRIGKRERVVAVPPRAGAVVQFDVARLRAIEGWVLLSRAGERIVPAFGTLEVELPDGTVRSPIADDGAFWVEDVPPGTHPARVLWQGEACPLALTVPDSEAGVIDVGTLRCEWREPTL